MTDRELLQQALEWVEWFASDDHSVRPTSKAREIAEAIQARLAQPEPEPEPEPEPVAWQVKFCDDDGIPQIAWFPHPVHPKSNLAKRPYIEEPLYTLEQVKDVAQKLADCALMSSPPKKEWVGLTDEEVEDILKLSKDAHEATKRIEAKLKEKNT